jgi:hypothetical protein
MQRKTEKCMAEKSLSFARLRQASRPKVYCLLSVIHFSVLAIGLVVATFPNDRLFSKILFWT